MREFNGCWYRSHDGLKLYARDYPCQGAHDESVETIVCIPGLTRNSADFTGLCQQLSCEFRVIAVDLRGRGRSDYDPAPENYQPAVYAKDIVSLLDAFGLTEVTLIGTSLGGLVSMLVADKVPARVAALILNDIGPEPNQSGLDRIKSYVRNPTPVASWEQAVAQTRAVLGSVYPKFDDAAWRLFTDNIYREGAGGVPVLDYDGAISVPFVQPGIIEGENSDLWPIFAALMSTPMLLIRGELSDILTPACVARMQALHPAMAYTEVEECGHAPLLTERSCQAAISRFLAERLAAAAMTFSV